jgi:hypothetical protein
MVLAISFLLDILLILLFQFCEVEWLGDHPQEDLTKFG